MLGPCFNTGTVGLPKPAACKRSAIDLHRWHFSSTQQQLKRAATAESFVSQNGNWPSAQHTMSIQAKLPA